GANILSLDEAGRLRPCPFAHQFRNQANFDSDAVRVWRESLETNRDAFRRTVIAVDSGRAVQIVNDYVEIAVVVQVGKSHSLSNTHLIETPTCSGVLKSEVASVAEGLLGLSHFGEKQELL